MTLLSTLAPEDAALIRMSMPHYMTASDSSKYAKPLKIWHMNYLPDNGKITNDHVMSLVSSSLASDEEKKSKVLEIQTERKNLNAWALLRVKNMFIQITRRYNLRNSGQEVHSFADVKKSLAQTFAANEESSEVRHIVYNWWGGSNECWRDILEEEYMRENNIVYRIMTEAETGKIRRGCIAKHVSQKYTDLVREIKLLMQKKNTNGNYLVKTLRRSNGKAETGTASSSTQQTFLACKSDSNSKSTVQPHIVCNGKCIVAKNLREQIAVEIQNRIDSENEIVVSNYFIFLLHSIIFT